MTVRWKNPAHAIKTPWFFWDGHPTFATESPTTWRIIRGLNDLNCLWKGGYQPLTICDGLPSIGFNDHPLPQQTYGNSDPSKAHPAMNKDSHQGKISGKSSENYRNSFYHLVFFQPWLITNTPSSKQKASQQNLEHDFRLGYPILYTSHYFASPAAI